MINVLLQVSILNELIKKNLQWFVVLDFMPFLLIKRTFEPLVASLGISSYRGEFIVIRLVLKLGEEFANWLFENHIDSLPHPTFIVCQIFSLLFECHLEMMTL